QPLLENVVRTIVQRGGCFGGGEVDPGQFGGKAYGRRRTRIRQQHRADESKRLYMLVFEDLGIGVDRATRYAALTEQLEPMIGGQLLEFRLQLRRQRLLMSRAVSLSTKSVIVEEVCTAGDLGD